MLDGMGLPGGSTMSLQAPGDAEKLRTLLVALDRLLEVPPGHLKRLTPLLSHRLRDVILAYLAVRELARGQKIEVTLRAVPAGSGPAHRSH